MITGAIKSQVDQIWNAFWSGGISNPMEVIEQMRCADRARLNQHIAVVEAFIAQA